jgi:hypothetical protein
MLNKLVLPLVKKQTDKKTKRKKTTFLSFIEITWQDKTVYEINHILYQLSEFL